MTRRLVFGFIKFLTMSAPFLSMMIMILALWGVVGKASYPDLVAATGQGQALGAREAKNYLVNETKTIDQCGQELKSAEIVSNGETPVHVKIDWEHVV